jgi:meiotic recombination protein REC8, fungi type
LLSTSFDASFSGSGNLLLDLSSSQMDYGFGFDNDFFAENDLDLGLDIGDELARELGEGWGVPPSQEQDQ